MKPNLVPLLFLGVLSTSLAGNVYLGMLLRSSRIPTQATNLEADVHQRLDSMVVAGPDGSVTRLSLKDDRPTVIYVFSPTCSWCARNLQNIQALALKEKAQYRFVGLSISSHGLAAYLQKHPLPFPAYEDVSDADLKSIDFRGTPQTLIVDSAGTVTHNWRGAYATGTADAVGKYFAVQLPGLIATQLPLASSASTGKLIP